MDRTPKTNNVTSVTGGMYRKKSEEIVKNPPNLIEDINLQIQAQYTSE